MSWTAEQGAMLGEVERAYQELVSTTRQLRPSDDLFEDLEIGSLLAQELLVALEDRYGVVLIGDADVARARTVGDLVEAPRRKVDAR